MTDTYKPAADVEELTRLVKAASAAFIPLTLRMATDLTAETQNRMVSLKERGWSIGLEVTVDPYSQQKVCLIAIGPKGEREPLATIAQGAPSAPS